jgi:tRNA pseudouridine13 synthase
LPELDALPSEVRVGFEGGSLPSTAPTPGLWVTEAIRHRNKLKRGHVRVNRFRIRIREVPVGGLERGLAAAETLQRIGIPNRFGSQRYGRDGDNAARARRILAGEERPPKRRHLKSLLFSSLQSELFDRVLMERHRRGWWSTALRGDVMVRHEPPAMFDVTDPLADQPRVDRLEISPTGPIYGKSTRRAGGVAAALEHDVLAASGLSHAEVTRLGPGSRRALRLPAPHDLDISAPACGELDLVFSLPAGAYATVLLEEICELRAIRAVEDAV